MKSLQDILAGVQALATVPEDQFEASLASVVTDLQSIIASTPTAPAADPIVSVTTTTQSGATAVFIPQA